MFGVLSLLNLLRVTNIFLTIVDDCTRVTWVYMMKYKSDVLTIFPAFLKFVLTQYNSTVKA